MLNRVTVTGYDGEILDCSFLDMGVSYNTFRDPKDFNKPPGIYWIQGSGGHYSEWDGQKFNDDTEGARKATNDYYRNWHDSSHYYATGGAGIWQEPYKGEYPKSVTLPYSGGEPKVMLLKTGNPMADMAKYLKDKLGEEGYKEHQKIMESGTTINWNRSPQHE